MSDFEAGSEGARLSSGVVPHRLVERSFEIFGLGLGLALLLRECVMVGRGAAGGGAVARVAVGAVCGLLVLGGTFLEIGSAGELTAELLAQVLALAL